MSIQNKIGDHGESLAKDFLIDKGYSIIEQNWRFSKAEIDIIAKKQDLLVFVEVKTRSYVYNDRTPEGAVTHHKEKQIADAAAAYMRFIGHEWAFRFDVISILLPQNGSVRIEHYEDAFFPGLD